MEGVNKSPRNNPNRRAKNTLKKYKAPGAADNHFLSIDNMQREFALEMEARKRKYRKKNLKEKRKNDQCL